MKKAITIDIDTDGIALLTIDQHDKSMNVIDGVLMEELSAHVDAIITDDTIKGAVITSSKKSGFIAGADLNMLATIPTQASPREMFKGVYELNRILRRLETGGKSAKELQKGAFAKPVAAAINGLALGGGLELCLACHYRVASDHPKLQLGLPEVLVGFFPGAGGTQRVPRLAGIQMALQMMTTGKAHSATEAKAMNLIHDIVPHADIVHKAKEWVKANPKVRQPWDAPKFRFPGGQGAMDPRVVPVFAGASAMSQAKTYHNMPNVDAILSCVYEGSIVPIDTALRIETKYAVNVLRHPNAKNMMRTLFINKQAAEKGAARPASVPPTTIKKIGVLGAGMMGAGIAYVTAKAGLQVVLLDRDMAAAEKGKDYTRKLIEKGVARGKVSKEKAQRILDNIATSAAYEDLRDVDMIIEAVFEDIKVKEDVISKAESVIGADVVFATNTSTIPIGNLAKFSTRPDKFIGVHFFSPVDKMPLVEIIPSAQSGDLPLAVALDYVKLIRKTPIVVSDTRGFYCNSVVMPYLNEAMLMLKEGINPALIENCAKQLGMPVGPLALTDETSQELGLRISNAAKAELGDAYTPTGTEDMLELFVNKLGRKGRKSGGGFYTYPQDGSGKYLWHGLAEHFPAAAVQPDAAQAKERLLYIQLACVVKCYADGVVHDPQSADLGAIFGWGFAPWTGGPMSHIDTIGIKAYVEKSMALAKKHGTRFTPPARLQEMATQSESFYAA